MRAIPVAAGVLGLATIVALVLRFGAGGVFDALAAVGWLGFGAILLLHLALIAVMGIAWRALIPATKPRTLIWGRLIRDSGSEVLPLSQVGGYVLGVRAVTLAGVGATLAAASTIVDVTLEFLAQLAYTALGLGGLVHLQPKADVALPVAIGIPVGTAAAAAFVLVQRRGFSLFERLARLVGRGWIDRSAVGAAALHAALAEIYQRRAGLAANFSLHLACWIASGVEAYIALRLAGARLDFEAVLVIESLVYATRTVAFAIPNAVGVQEGAYLLIGAAFGLTPQLALALSLLKRARDLTIGVPALGIWQMQEGSRLWRGHRAAAQPARDDAAAPPLAPDDADLSGGTVGRELVVTHDPIEDE